MMTVLFWPLVVWGAITTLLIILIIYRSTLTMQEDDQLFLGDSASQMEKDQIEILNKVQKISPYVRWLGATSGVMILIIGGIALYQGLSQSSRLVRLANGTVSATLQGQVYSPGDSSCAKCSVSRTLLVACLPKISSQ